MWVFDKNSNESYIHVCNGKTLKQMGNKLEIRKHDVSIFSMTYNEKGNIQMNHFNFCPYCGTDLQKDEDENAITEPKQQNKIYWYAYRLRGFSPFCQPKDFIDHNDNVGRHGIIAYNRPLTASELDEFELIPYEL